MSFDQAFKNTLVNDITNIGKREGLEDHEQVWFLFRVYFVLNIILLPLGI